MVRYSLFAFAFSWSIWIPLRRRPSFLLALLAESHRNARHTADAIHTPISRATTALLSTLISYH